MKTWSLHSDLRGCNTCVCPQITTGCADLVPAQSEGLFLPLHASVWITGWLWWVWNYILFFICMYMTCIFLDCHCWIHSALVHFTRSYSLRINCGEKGNGALANFKIKCISLPGFSDPLADLNVEAMSSDKESGDSGSQNDLSRILALPTPADFMSPAPSALPKLMTPDAFMTPSASVSF